MDRDVVSSPLCMTVQALFTSWLSEVSYWEKSTFTDVVLMQTDFYVLTHILRVSFFSRRHHVHTELKPESPEKCHKASHNCMFSVLRWVIISNHNTSQTQRSTQKPHRPQLSTRQGSLWHLHLQISFYTQSLVCVRVGMRCVLVNVTVSCHTM